MKKFLFIFALAAIFAIATTPVKANSFISKTSDVVLTTDVDDVNTVPEGDEKKDDKKKKVVKKTTSCCSSKAAVKSGCSEAQKKSCAASKVSCSETKSEKEEDKK
jgi:hypothetical protein